MEPTLDAPVEKCGWLVRRSDLNLLEVGPLALAAGCKVGALYRRSRGVLEGLSTSEHIIELLPL